MSRAVAHNKLEAQFDGEFSSERRRAPSRHERLDAGTEFVGSCKSNSAGRIGGGHSWRARTRACKQNLETVDKRAKQTFSPKVRREAERKEWRPNRRNAMPM